MCSLNVNIYARLHIFSKLLKQLVERYWLIQIGRVCPLLYQFYRH